MTSEGYKDSSEVLYSKQTESYRPEENPEAIRDVEAGPTITATNTGTTMYSSSQQQPSSAVPPATTATTATTTTYTAAPARRTATTPAPREGGEDKKGFLQQFATRSTGSTFFALHAGIAFFSFLVFIASALAENENLSTPAGQVVPNRFVEYMLVISQTSFAISLAACVLERAALLEHRGTRIALSGFQVMFWVPALVLITFFVTFALPLLVANAYFGAWGALTLATIALVYEAERFKHRDQRDRITAPRAASVLLFFFSLMVMGQGIVLYSSATSSTTGTFNNAVAPYTYTVFAIAFGAITAFLSLIMIIMLGTTPPAAMLSFGIFLWLWVAVSVLVLTFGEPFNFALGNGYYACLFSLLSSFGLLTSMNSAKQRREDEQQQSGGTDNVVMDIDKERASRRFFMYIRVMTFASLVVMIAASLICSSSEQGGCPSGMVIYHVAAGAIPLGLGLIVVVGELFGLYKISAWPKMAFAVLMLAWWIAAFVVLTYFGAFRTPVWYWSYYANGFFFTWVALISSGLAFAETLKESAYQTDPPNPAIPKTGFLLIVILGSAIEMGAGIHWYYRLGASSMTIYSICLGAVSIFLVLVMYCGLGGTRNNYDLHDSFHNGGLYVLTLWWAVGALILTFDGFWVQALDNGYFSVYFTLGACLLALSGIWGVDEPRNTDRDRFD